MINAVVYVHQRTLRFFQGSNLPTVAIVQLKLSNLCSDLELPYEITNSFLDGFSLGLVDFQEVIRHDLHAPSVPGLKAGYPRPIVKASITFDLGTTKGREVYKTSLRQLLEACDQMGVTKIMFLVVTHSDTSSGNLHFTTEGQGGAAPLNEVMGGLFPPVACRWLQSRSSHLLIMVCGNRCLHERDYNHLTAKAESGVFNDVIMFPAPRLQPCYVAPFAARFAENIFYDGLSSEEGIKHALFDLPALGQHSRVLHILAKDKGKFEAFRWAWCHEKYRPYGVETPGQCPQCKCLKAMERGVKLVKESQEVVFHCHGKLPCDPNSQTNFQHACTYDLRVAVTKAELGLEKGRGSGFGKWCKHEFKWSRDLVKRF
ncbi:hypothetical protein VKT23_015342 [Stygiomarasmius scandens]|uniref:Uncharacterized protein n=1 Tax=Marasmiellus scandens TaxID=2682957 RepID=A0ABR1IY27_9AGAR